MELQYLLYPTGGDGITVHATFASTLRTPNQRYEILEEKKKHQHLLT